MKEGIMGTQEDAAQFAEAFQRWCLRNRVDQNSTLFVSSLTVTLKNYCEVASTSNSDGIVKGG